MSNYIDPMVDPLRAKPKDLEDKLREVLRRNLGYPNPAATLITEIHARKNGRILWTSLGTSLAAMALAATSAWYSYLDWKSDTKWQEVQLTRLTELRDGNDTQTEILERTLKVQGAQLTLLGRKENKKSLENGERRN